MDLSQFLEQKRIDAAAWKAARPEEFAKLEGIFAIAGPVSFDQQKKFLFNPARLAFPLPPERVAALEKAARPSASEGLPKKKLPLRVQPAASEAPAADPSTTEPPSPVLPAGEAPATEAAPLPRKKPGLKTTTAPASPEAAPADSPLPPKKKPLLRTITPDPGSAEAREAAPASPEPPEASAPPARKKIQLKTRPRPEEES